jgi:hypothetical protein
MTGDRDALITRTAPLNSAVFFWERAPVEYGRDGHYRGFEPERPLRMRPLRTRPRRTRQGAHPAVGWRQRRGKTEWG